jgi:hypothetical protein
LKFVSETLEIAEGVVLLVQTDCRVSVELDPDAGDVIRNVAIIDAALRQVIIERLERTPARPCAHCH